MNDKIKELVKQAIVDVKDEFGNWIGSDFDKQKFAKLIIEECCEVVRYTDAVDIKKHFGIDE